MKRQQGDLLPMVKFREILRLRELGYNQILNVNLIDEVATTKWWIRPSFAQLI